MFDAGTAATEDTNWTGHQIAIKIAAVGDAIQVQASLIALVTGTSLSIHHRLDSLMNGASRNIPTLYVDW